MTDMQADEKKTLAELKTAHSKQRLEFPFRNQNGIEKESKMNLQNI
jgi:hypothetical protein